MKLENTKSTLKIEYQRSSGLNACPNERGLRGVTTLGCPQDDNPLSYDRQDGEWLIWYEVAHRFERKVPTQDRGDIRHNIILELALARRRDGNKPFNEAMMFRVASFVIVDYWRKANRKPTILSLNNEVDNGDGDTTELINTVADALRACGGMVELKLVDSKSPMLFTSPDYELVVMPMLTSESQKPKGETETAEAEAETTEVEQAEGEEAEKAEAVAEAEAITKAEKPKRKHKAKEPVAV